MIGILEVYAATLVPINWARGKCSCFARDQGEGMAGQLEQCWRCQSESSPPWHTT